MERSTRNLVRQRAGERCEYCRRHQRYSPLTPHQIEHIIARKHAGPDDETNLALACVSCNLHKGPNLAGLDPETGELTPLFNPRVDLWEDHFSFDGARLRGITAIGRTTIEVLNMNSPQQVRLRTIIGNDW